MSAAAASVAAPSPGALYRRGVASGSWQDDPAQHAALLEMDRLNAALTAPPPRSLWQRLGLQQGQVVDGLYLWGAVGRGKTFLMDLLVESLPPGVAERHHFHHFMQDVHAQLRSMPHQRDPLARVGTAWAARTRLLCLDEFQVIDIGDAMLLGRLLRALITERVCLVTTSNLAPSKLYSGGLQRARFLPAIALIEQHCHVVELASVHDWRLQSLHLTTLYQTPLGIAAHRGLRRAFDSVARGAVREGGTIRINQRDIPLQRCARGIAWFDFPDLCEGPRAVADYIELARRFAVLVIASVPQFNPDHEDAARRFVHLVDELYDRRVKLVLSAAVPIIDLYEGRRLRAEFARTESRLIEMQGAEYLAL